MSLPSESFAQRGCKQERTERDLTRIHQQGFL